MLRYLLVFLALLVAVLAFLFNRPWLWVGAGVVFVGGLGYFGWQFWTSLTEKGDSPSSSPEDPTASSESLEALGIMGIRPKSESSAEGPGDSVSDARAPGPEGDEGASESLASRDPGATPVSEASGSEPDTPARVDEGEQETDRSVDRTVVTGDRPVLGPLVQSLRAASGAKTVCLLVQENVALSYRIEVLASTLPQARLRGTFNTQAPLLTASMVERGVTVRKLPEDGLAVEDLGYYQTPPSIDHVAVVPVPRPDNPSNTFLVADASRDTDLGSPRLRTILERYAELVDLVLASDHSALEGGSGPEAATADAVDERVSESNGIDQSDRGPRPRRELIAEEMEAARAASQELALVLVHLNRAESIARRGEEAVASAERLFRARLEQAVPNQRVERFGELTYGVFYRGDLEGVENWVADLESTMDAEKGELEGGVSVGVSIWSGDDTDAGALREDAIDALREAYETGTSTIVG